MHITDVMGVSGVVVCVLRTSHFGVVGIVNEVKIEKVVKTFYHRESCHL